MTKRNQVQLYDRVVVEDTVEADEKPARANKRTAARQKARYDSQHDDGSKTNANGKRGRPRVDPQEESAIERRRTQIRLAQRAYRERKETTISTLEKQVGQLKQTISQMNQAFLEFNDKTVASGIIAWKPSIGENLKLTMQRFIELTRDADPDADVKANMSSPTVSAWKPSRPAGQGVHKSTKSMEDRAAGKPAVTEPSPRPVEPAAMWGYQVTYEDVTDSVMHDTEDPPATNQQIVRKVDDSAWLADPSPSRQQYHSEPHVPSHTEDWRSTIDRSLKHIHTYSFQETTFARRLTRDSYEKMYYLLTNPKIPPEVIERKVRYSFCFGNRSMLIHKVKEILNRSTREPLGNWEFPMLHVGGAGLHFPRDDGKDVEPPQGWLSQRNVGPWPIHRAHTTTPAEDFPENVTKWSDLKGVYFDNNDVEMYLRTKGLFLDGSSAVAEIEIEDTGPFATAESYTSSPHGSLSTIDTSGPQSPAIVNGKVEPLSPPLHLFWQYVETSDSVMSGTVDHGLGLLHSTGDEPKKLSASDQESQNIINSISPMALVPRRRKINIDVDKLLNILNEKAVCLGRTPGYKQEDVDSALDEVIREGW